MSNSQTISSADFPKLYNREIGIKDGFVDGAKLSETCEHSPAGAEIRIRKRIAGKLRTESWPYFVGYVLGRELFGIYSFISSGETIS